MRSIAFMTLLLVTVISLPAVEVVLAPLFVVGETSGGASLPEGHTVSTKLKKRLSFLDSSGLLGASVRDLPPGEEAPQSVLDAGSFCAYHGLEMLVYGRLSGTAEYLDGVLKVYDAQSGKIRRTLYSRDSADNLDRLVVDLAAKLHAYLTEGLGLAPIIPRREAERALWDLRGGIGYWTPVGTWRENLSGIISVDLTGYLTPRYPLIEYGPWCFALRFGASFGYDIGKDTPEHERFLFHGLRFGIPVEFYADFRDDHRISVSLQPFVMMDILIQDRLYSGKWSGSTTTGGLAFAASYRFAINTSSAVGVSCEFSWVFYDPVRYTLRPTIYYEYRLPKRHKGVNDEV